MNDFCITYSKYSNEPQKFNKFVIATIKSISGITNVYNPPISQTIQSVRDSRKPTAESVGGAITTAVATQNGRPGLHHHPPSIHYQQDTITHTHFVKIVRYLSRFFISLFAGMLLSVPFLLITLFVYACIPELRNMHGKSLMCYVLGLTVGYTALSLVQMRLFAAETTPCVVAGYTLYFFFMVSFFWLNVMSFDIYWTFRWVISWRAWSKSYGGFNWPLKSFISF